MMEGKLYRSRSEKMVAGVCGGLGQYLGIDVTLVRLFFVFLGFFDGIGLVLYVVLAFLMPQVPQGEEITQTAAVPLTENPNATKLVGGGLVVLGLVALVSNFRIPWLVWVNWHNLWPLMLILVGGVLLWRTMRGEE